MNEDSSSPIRIAFIGNSYIYYNDLARLIEELFGGSNKVSTCVCLRGGATIVSLLSEGSSMEKKFGSSPNSKLEDGSLDIGARTVQELLRHKDGWDYVVVNEHSMGAFVPQQHRDGLKNLNNIVGPLIKAAGATAIMMQTPAYRKHTNGSEKFGSLEEFAETQKNGVEAYRDCLAETVTDTRRLPRIASVSVAFSKVKAERPSLWHDLYAPDDFHPSAVGSYLMACVVFCTITQREPDHRFALPDDPDSLYNRSRIELSGRLPSKEEMEYLLNVASTVALE